MVHFDIRTAYFNSTIDKLIFRDLPIGFEAFFNNRFPGRRSKVCCILKGLSASRNVPADGTRFFPTS